MTFQASTHLFASFLILLLVIDFARGDSVYFESNEYSTGALGSGPYQSFFSTGFTPAEWNFVIPVNRSTQLTSGLMFMAPRGASTNQPGAAIFDQTGSLVWDGSQYGETLAFSQQTYLGEPHIMVWQGDVLSSGVGSGFQLLINQQYQVVSNFTTNLQGDTGATFADFHEGQITPNNTALLTAYQFTQMDLSAYDGPQDGWIHDSVAQELNVTTGEALFTWKASEHVNPSDCYTAVGSGGTSTDNAWDYFHLNSIEKGSDGNFLISSRHCSTLYYLDGSSGDIIWRMGGRNSSFTMGNGTEFSWQHHSRWVQQNETFATMTVFDNAGMFGVSDEPFSRGLYLSVNFTNMTVELITEFLPWNQTISQSQGSVQLQPNGNFLVGFGQIPWLAEYSPSGELLWTVQYGIGDVEGYRILRFNWTGTPTDSPSISLVNAQRSNLLSIYASWNGATDIQRWELFGASDASGSGAVSLYNKTKNGFETTITISTTAHTYSHFAVRAMGQKGQVLGISQFASNGAFNPKSKMILVLLMSGLVFLLQ